MNTDYITVFYCCLKIFSLKSYGKLCIVVQLHGLETEGHHQWSLEVSYDYSPFISLWNFRWAKRPILDLHILGQCGQG